MPLLHKSRSKLLLALVDPCTGLAYQTDGMRKRNARDVY